MKDPSSKVTSSGRAQAAWARSKMGIEGLFRIANRSIRDANQAFVHIDEPTRAQKAMKADLDKIEQELNDSKN